MKRYEKIFNESLSPSNYKRFLKGKLQDYFMQQGISITTTDSPEIVLFSDKPLTKKSIKYSKQSNLKNPYMTSFSVKQVEILLKGLI